MVRATIAIAVNFFILVCYEFIILKHTKNAKIPFKLLFIFQQEIVAKWFQIIISEAKRLAPVLIIGTAHIIFYYGILNGLQIENLWFYH